MIPNSAVHLVESSEIALSTSFGISRENESHIMGILRDTLYSDKVLAVLREYGSNAWDAHRMAGKKDLPITVILPTAMEPTLAIRDFGPGLSQEDVVTVYTQYGASTKRNSDDAVGMLGIGCKSGFSYADSFTVTSFHGGLKRVYVAVLDSSDKGLMNQIHEEPCGDETGVLVELAVKPSDVREFVEKAQALFQYFTPRPNINTVLPEAPAGRAPLVNGVIFESEGYYTSWTAVMGCVPYRVNIDQLRNMGAQGISALVGRLSGVLFFNIGDVQVSASREELKYSDATKAALVKKAHALVDEYVRSIVEDLETGDYTPWARRVKAQLLRRLDLSLPATAKDLAASSITFPAALAGPGTFTISQGNQAQSVRLEVDPGTTLILRDENKRSIQGYRLSRTAYLVKPTGRTALATVKTDLDRFLAQLKCTGVPIVNLSDQAWHAPTKTSAGRTLNAKHRVSSFQLTSFSAAAESSGIRSQLWEAVQRTPTPEDVYVVLNKFEAREDPDFYTHLRQDRKFVGAFGGGPLPQIYGYKTTESKPVDSTTCVGVPYPTWRAKFLLSLLTPAMKARITEWQWTTIVSDRYHYRESSGGRDAWHLLLTQQLGASHALVTFVDKYAAARKALNTHEQNTFIAYYELIGAVSGPSEAAMALTSLEAKYPLLSHDQVDLYSALRIEASKWAHYINAVDHFEGCTNVTK